MKKILSTVLALAMVVSLGACGSSGGGSSSGSGSGSGDTIKIGYFSDMSSADDTLAWLAVTPSRTASKS